MRRHVVAAAIGAACLSFGLAPQASAEPLPPSGFVIDIPKPDLQQFVKPEDRVFGGPSKALNLSQQVQEKDQWCTNGVGASIEAFHGKPIAQVDFCRAQRDLSSTQACPNEGSTTDMYYHGFVKTNFNASKAYSPIKWEQVIAEIDANRPVAVNVAWTVGGGHARAFYGYNTTGSIVNFSDPWPTEERYQTMSYNDFVKNGEFSWISTIYGISPSGSTTPTNPTTPPRPSTGSAG